MPMLPNGDVVPSFLSVDSALPMYDGDAFNNVRLRIGEVQELIYPDDKRSRSKKFIEYRVFVQQRSNGTGNGKMYENCLLVNLFGGLADRCEYTLRADKSTDRPKEGVGKGSKVLVLCVNGSSNHSYIVGGVRDAKDLSDKDIAKDLGHHYYWVFNGVSMYVDNDGQFLLTYNGKTDADGKTEVKDSERGTRMAFLKDGSWNINTRDPDDQNKTDQYIFIDHKSRKSIHRAKNEWQLQVASGKATILADQGLHVGDATDEVLLGKSYRDAQKQLNDKLADILQQISIQLSSAVDPSSGAPITQVQAAGALCAQAVMAIKQFEASASAKNSFLSKKNKTD
jgi:hypothetical protein